MSAVTLRRGAAFALVLAVLPILATPAAADPPASIQRVGADGETVPVTHAQDAADDPAIWVDQANPGRSLVIGNDKRGALETYDLSGALVQRITTPSGNWGNVDVRQDVRVGTRAYDVVGVTRGGMRFYAVDAATRQLRLITDGTGTLGTGGGEGFCLYHSGSGALYAFVNNIHGRYRQYRISDPDNDGLLQSSLVREFTLGTETEGCVADDTNGALYVSQEDVALWRYGAEPGDGTARTQVDSVGAGGNLANDIEGLALAGTYLIASAQNINDPSNSYFAVYARGGGNAYLKAFRIVNGASADGCQRTDGIAAHGGSLGPSFPDGIFVCQDNFNSAPGTGNQDFKLVRLDKVVSV